MLQQVLQNYILKMIQTMHLYKNYAIRHNPIRIIQEQIVSALKNFLSVGKKKKMAQYRVNSQIYKCRKMEQQIAQSNEHLFLQGRKLNEIR